MENHRCLDLAAKISAVFLLAAPIVMLLVGQSAYGRFSICIALALGEAQPVKEGLLIGLVIAVIWIADRFAYPLSPPGSILWSWFMVIFPWVLLLVGCCQIIYCIGQPCKPELPA